MANRKIKVSWNVSDGYINGGSRPQSTIITEDHLYCGGWGEFDELSKEEQDEMINELVHDDFKQVVSFDISNIEHIQ